MSNKAGLARDVKWPDVETFGELFESFTTDKDSAPPDVKLSVKPEPRTGRMGAIRSYIWMPGYKSGYAKLHRKYEDALRRELFESLTVSFRAVTHADRGYTLILAEYGEIIGSHWLAYVRTDSLPKEEIAP